MANGVQVFIHTQTGGVTLQAQQPEVNIVRTAIEALAAVLGGTQSLHTNSFDEALALPTEHAVRLALRTQQVIAHESGVTNTVDPVGGSYAIETLTDEIEARALEMIRRVDALGGMVMIVGELGDGDRAPAAGRDAHRRAVVDTERGAVRVERPSEAVVVALRERGAYV